MSPIFASCIIIGYLLVMLIVMRQLEILLKEHEFESKKERSSLSSLVTILSLLWIIWLPIVLISNLFHKEK